MMTKNVKPNKLANIKPPHRAALFLLMEPVLAPIWAWLGVGETPGNTEMFGGLIVLGFVSYKIIDQFRDTEDT